MIQGGGEGKAESKHTLVSLTFESSERPRRTDHDTSQQVLCFLSFASSYAAHASAHAYTDTHTHTTAVPIRLDWLLRSSSPSFLFRSSRPFPWSLPHLSACFPIISNAQNPTSPPADPRACFLVFSSHHSLTPPRYVHSTSLACATHNPMHPHTPPLPLHEPLGRQRLKVLGERPEEDHHRPRGQRALHVLLGQLVGQELLVEAR